MPNTGCDFTHPIVGLEIESQALRVCIATEAMDTGEELGLSTQF